ncbi:MAG: 50S ribosomal protein L11 methyltransferase [Hyphomonadaceae bacterium]
MQDQNASSRLAKPIVIAMAALRLAAKTPASSSDQRDLMIARGWLEDGLKKFPDHPALKRAQALLAVTRIPDWHFPMLRDDRRNRAYEAAILQSVRPGHRVFEIGTGSGLLAMMAVKAGAEHVVTCEVDPQIAETARAIIAANGLSDRITVKTAMSTELSAQDIGGKADILVSEVFGASLMEEGALLSIQHAREHLVKAGGAIIPAKGRLMAALGTYESRTAENLQDVCGFDLSAFMRFRSERRMIGSSNTKLTLAGPATPLFALDFATRDIPRASEVELALASNSDRPNVVATWLALELAPGVSYSNAPEPGYQSHWGVTLYEIPASHRPRRGDVLDIGAAHDVALVHIWFPD